MFAGQNGWSDTPEDEQEALSAWDASWDIPDSLPPGAPDPWDDEDWPEGLAGAEYWIWKRILEAEDGEEV